MVLMGRRFQAECELDGCARGRIRKEPRVEGILIVFDHDPRRNDRTDRLVAAGRILVEQDESRLHVEERLRRRPFHQQRLEARGHAGRQRFAMLRS